ncbi:putative GTPase IMAP family member 2-like [Triplophysa rosa]|uniref:GTPase IMAP family member 2-like n=1 Tax=Triplophysa rosa TaxID=992332 RepID=A0A9W7TD03_TRIRA|nr:putative GTPase IMAP family member 2-like [Triplophysa rosa]
MDDEVHKQSGPRVFLLVMDLSSSFTDEDRISFEEHTSLFGERIWSHTLLISTHELTSSQKHKCVKEQGDDDDDVQQILQKCAGRYHVLDIDNKENGVQELLMKMDGVVAANNNMYFDPCQDQLIEILRKRDENKTNAQARKRTMEDKRKLLRKTHDENLTELIKLIKREVGRWEVIEMDEFLNISQNSETLCDDKVLGWQLWI